MKYLIELEKSDIIDDFRNNIDKIVNHHNIPKHIIKEMTLSEFDNLQMNEISFTRYACEFFLEDLSKIKNSNFMLSAINLYVPKEKSHILMESLFEFQNKKNFKAPTDLIISLYSSNKITDQFLSNFIESVDVDELIYELHRNKDYKYKNITNIDELLDICNYTLPVYIKNDKTFSYLNEDYAKRFFFQLSYDKHEIIRKSGKFSNILDYYKYVAPFDIESELFIFSAKNFKRRPSNWSMGSYLIKEYFNAKLPKTQNLEESFERLNKYLNHDYQSFKSKYINYFLKKHNYDLNDFCIKKLNDSIYCYMFANYLTNQSYEKDELFVKIVTRIFHGLNCASKSNGSCPKELRDAAFFYPKFKTCGYYNQLNTRGN